MPFPFMLQQALPATLSADQIVQQALDEQGQKNGVQVMLVPKTNSYISAGGRYRNALAARNTDGEEFILVNQDAKTDDIEQAIRHEVSHILTWRQYGEGVREHGPEFVKMCRKVVTENRNAFCERQ